MATSEARKIAALKTDETRRIESRLQGQFPRVDAYRYNTASIRIRVIDERFAGKSNPQREILVEPSLAKLPEETQADVTVLLLLAPDEVRDSLANIEFENPTPSQV